MDIYFTYESATCDQYMNSPMGNKEEVTKVIAPLRVEGTGTEKLRLISGCNFFEHCMNIDCFYSAASRQVAKAKNPKKK